MSRRGIFSSSTNAGRFANDELRKLRAGGDRKPSGYRVASSGFDAADSRGDRYAGSGSSPCAAILADQNSHLPDGVGKPPSAKGAYGRGTSSRWKPAAFSASQSMPALR